MSKKVTERLNISEICRLRLFEKKKVSKTEPCGTSFEISVLPDVIHKKCIYPSDRFT